MFNGVLTIVNFAFNPPPLRRGFGGGFALSYLSVARYPKELQKSVKFVNIIYLQTPLDTSVAYATSV